MTAFARELDSKTRRGRDSGDDGDPSGEGLLHNFEGGASAHEEDVMGEGKFFIEEGPADDFIDSVVPADVFVGDEKVASEVKECSGMKAAGLGEGGLFEMKLFRERTNHFR